MSREQYPPSVVIHKNSLMKILYYDCFSGISGDMNLGAMLDLGVSSEVLISGLEKLGVSGWKLDISRDQRHGISGTRVTVITDENEAHTMMEVVDNHHHDHDHGDHHHEHDHGDHHDHDHGDHHHDHGHADHRHDGHDTAPEVKEHHHGASRNLDDIEAIINSSKLPERVREISMKIFTRIAVAESEVHNKPLREIHFHEVGAIDSIVDIVGAAICFNELGADRIYVSPVELGSGMVQCQHGLLPVPAPATAKIISGFPVHTGGVSFEATTPTGAAIIAAMAEPLPAGTNLTIEKSGYGIGHKVNPERPNILRIFLAETPSEEEKGHQSLLVECNIDDMNPETTDYISGRLFATGAGDIFMTPVIMKKGRPAIKISVICEPDQLEKVREILFSETTTIGLRVISFTKETLERRFEEIETPYGRVTVKRSYYKDSLVSVKPEAEQCAAIAARTGLPMKQVMQEITALLK